MLTERELQLAGEILNWLETGPELEDISYYIQKLDPNGKSIVARLTEIAADRWYIQKLREFDRRKISVLSTELTESEQIRFVALCSLYSHTSVLAAYSKQYPKLGALTLSEDFGGWATGYISGWYALTTLLCYSDYEIERQYLSSLISTQKEENSLRVLLAKLTTELRAERQRQEVGRDATQKEKDDFSAILKELEFLPESIINDYINPGYIDVKIVFLLRIIDVLHVILAIGLASVVSDIKNAEAVLLERLRSEEEDEVIGYMEDNRLDSHDFSPLVESLAAVMKVVWSKENILANRSKDLLINYAQGLTSEQKKVFVKQLYRALRRDTALQVFFDPIDPAYVCMRVRNINDLPTLQRFITEMIEVIEDSGYIGQVEIVRNLILTYHAITHAIPEESIRPTQTR